MVSYSAVLIKCCPESVQTKTIHGKLPLHYVWFDQKNSFLPDLACHTKLLQTNLHTNLHITQWSPPTQQSVLHPHTRHQLLPKL